MRLRPIEIQWENTIGGNTTDELISVQQTNDGGYILGGHSWSDISGDKTENSNGEVDYWIVKIAPDTITGSSETPLPNGDEICLAPNPFTDNFSIINFTLQEKAEVRVYDVYGRIIAEKTISVSNNKFQTSAFAPGIYFVEVLTGNQKWVRKVVKQ